MFVISLEVFFVCVILICLYFVWVFKCWSFLSCVCWFVFNVDLFVRMSIGCLVWWVIFFVKINLSFFVLFVMRYIFLFFYGRFMFWLVICILCNLLMYCLLVLYLMCWFFVCFLFFFSFFIIFLMFLFELILIVWLINFLFFRLVVLRSVDSFENEYFFFWVEVSSWIRILFCGLFLRRFCIVLSVCLV